MDHDAAIRGMIAGGEFMRLVFVHEDHHRIARAFLKGKPPENSRDFQIQYAVFQLIAGLQILCPMGERNQDVKMIKNHERLFSENLQEVCHIVGDLFRTNKPASNKQRIIAWRAVNEAKDNLWSFGFRDFALSVSLYLQHNSPKQLEAQPVRPAWRPFTFRPNVPSALSRA